MNNSIDAEQERAATICRTGGRYRDQREESKDTADETFARWRVRGEDHRDATGNASGELSYAKWTLRLLARRIVELDIVGPVTYQTMGCTRKIRNEHHTRFSIG